MRSLAPIAIFLMMMSVVFWSFNRNLVMILDIIALIFLIVQAFRRQKNESVVFLAIIITIIVMIIDIFAKK